MNGLSDVTALMLQCMAGLWNFLYSGSGYIGLAVIASFIMKKLFKFFKFL